MIRCDICGKPPLGTVKVPYTGPYCEGHNRDSEKLAQILEEMWRQPLKIYDEDLENLKWGYSNREITSQMLRLALERGEITIQQFVKIIKQ